MRLPDLFGRRVAVWGYGREGRAALRILRRVLPGQDFSLICTAAERDVALADAGGAPLDIVTASPDAAVLGAFDVIVKSPGISAYTPALLAAQQSGARVTSGTALWFGEHPQARVIGVTATKGKSTTSALIAHGLRALGRVTALAGNIGLPLLDLLDPPRAPVWWVVELSSFQTREAGPLAVGVVGNLYEEHLDWHGTRERYWDDKLALADRAATLLVNAQQTELLERTAAHPRRLLFGAAPGWHLRDGAICRGGQRVLALAQLPLPGLHNALNACAALAAIEAAGEDAEAAAASFAWFRPLPHRLQTLGEQAGRTWINDSIATTPAATLEALHSLGGREVSVLVGGYERGVDWAPFAAAVRAQPPRALVCLGANGPRIAAALTAAGPTPYALERATTLAEAVTIARGLTPPGGVVLLSPGAPSFDAFRDYAERGRAFAALAGFDPAAIAGIEGLGIA